MPPRLTPVEDEDYLSPRLTLVGQGDEEYRAPRLTLVDDEISTGDRFTRGLSRGVDQAEGLLYSAGEALGEKIGSDTLTQFGRRGAAVNQNEAESVGAAPEFTDIRSLSDFGNWATETAGTLIPLAVPVIAGALAGGPLGAFAVAAPLGVGEVQQGIKEKDPLAEGKAAYVFGGGAAIAALDSVLPGLIIAPRLVRAFGREGAESIARRALEKPVRENFIKRTATGAAEGMLVEGATEALQEAIGEYAAARATNEPISSRLGEQMIEAAAAGALFGGATGGASRAFERGSEKPATEPRTAPEPIIVQPQTPADQQPTPQQPAINLPMAPLTPEDIEGPLPNDVVSIGKAIIDASDRSGDPFSVAAPPAASGAVVDTSPTSAGTAQPIQQPAVAPAAPLPVSGPRLTLVDAENPPLTGATAPPVRDQAPLAEPAVQTASIPATVSDVHAAADQAGIAWDNDPDFMNFTRSITSKDHLDKLNPAQIAAVKTAIESGQRPAVFNADDYFDRVMKYVRTPGKPVTAEAIAKAVGVQPSQAAQILGQVAQSPSARLRAGKNGAWQRQPRTGALDIVQFIASRGGIREHSGELAARDYGKIFVPRYGKLVRKTGMHLDDARKLAQEYGYLAPDTPGIESVSSVQDFMDAMDETVSRRRRVYSYDGSVEAEMAVDAGKVNERAEEDIRAFAVELGEPLSKADIAGILEIMAGGMDAESAVIEHIENVARQTEYDVSTKTESRGDEEYPGFESGPAQNDRPAGNLDEKPKGDAGRQGAADQVRAPAAQDRDGNERPPERTVDRTPEGDQTVLPGAERTEDAARAKRQADAKSEAVARAQQGKMRRGGQESVRDQDGGLFSAERDQEDMKFSLPRDDDAGAQQPSHTEIFDALRAALDGVGLKDVKLTIPIMIQDRDGGVLGLRGAYEATKNVISVAMTARDKIWTLSHEAVHALRNLGLFNKSEWSILRNKAQSDKKLTADIRRRYQRASLTEEGFIEEAVADMYADWRRGDTRAKGLIERLFTRIKNFLEAVGNALRGMGFKSAEDVFRSIERGEVGARERRGSVDGPVKFSTPDDLFGKSFDAPSEFVWRHLSVNNIRRMRRAELMLMADGVRQKLQDKFIPLRRTQEAILRADGEPELDLAVDAYLAEELSHGRIGSALRMLERDHIKPLITAMQAERLTVASVENYIYARHAPERNAKIAKINPEMQDGGSGMTNADAADVMNQPKETIAALERIAQRIDAMVDEALRVRVDAGLLSEEDAATWRNTYKHYVPLKGLPEMEPDAQVERPNIGKGFDMRGPESKRAMGRVSRATGILANVITAYEEAIVRGGKNDVGRTLLRLVERYPNPDFWEINRRELARKVNPETGMVEYVADPLYQVADNVLAVKIDGKPVYITLYHKGIARAMKNIGADTGNGLLRAMQRINRWMAFVNTSANPNFIISNFQRDILAAGINLQSVPAAKGMTAKIIKNTPAAIRGAYQAIRGGRADKWSVTYEAYAADGGITAFFALDDIDAQRKRIDDMIRDINKEGGLVHVKRLALTAEKMIQDANAAVENGVRLSAYSALRDAGVSREKSASVAKNLTVNFNRRGEWAGTASALYLFYNASAQGSVRLVQSLRHPLVQKIVGGIIAASAILDIANGLLSPDDEDGEKAYDKISGYTKDHNIILINPMGDGENIIAAKIPLPYGHNVFFVIGTKIGEQVRSALGIGPERSPLSQAADIALAALSAFNPIGGSDTVVSSLIPTVLKPFYETEVNRNFMGAPISPEPDKYGVPEPDSERYFKSVSQPAKWFARELNDLTGGDEVRPGAVDVSPETLDHFFKFVTGGAGTFVENTGDFFYKVLSGQASDIEWRRVPFAGRTIEGKNLYYERQRYYEIRDAAEMADAQLRLKVTKKDADGERDVRQSYAPELKVKTVFDESDKNLAKLRKAQKEIDADKDMPEDRRRMVTEAIQGQMNKVMADGVLYYNQVSQ
ncbi:MAG: LPD38 domain-containing protein [Alphaproteobacteria bacterium]